MKRISLITLSLAMASVALAQPKEVTKQYMENPNFEARFAAWVNPGSINFNVANTFDGRDGQVWMEKWVAKGSALGNNEGIYQTLRNLPTGTYTLVANAKNVSQSAPDKVCTGAFLYAGNEQTEIGQSGEYGVTFTVVNGKANVGLRLKSCNGNWVCVDNFRLFYNGENADSVAAEQARVDEELKALHEKVESATKTSLKVTTYNFVPTGNTIALGRSTVSGTCKEKGYCWSKEGEPTIFDDKTTEVFANNGDIYVMRGLQPATAYYVRPYAMTSGGYVAYGETKKIVTLPAGNMSYGFFNDNNGDAETCARINSASAECIWMYNQLSYIPGFYLSVHYVPGSGAGGGTADCSYGGWMRVSQNVPYQQTGTMLHETNHGVGVGTTGEWYNNSNLRAETSRGLWLGPIGTKMVRFFENSETATMTGDNTHMWPYGINGAHEDSYQPSNHCLYFANILITHALHQDGLPSTNGVGFASPAYVFEQRDTTKYYIKNNDETTGKLTGYLYAASTGVKWNAISATEAKADDNYAWHILYDAKTRLYYFQNVGTGKLITYNAGFKLVSRNNPSDAEKLHLMPARINTTFGSGRTALTKTAFWVMKPDKYNSQAMEATANGVSNKKIDLTNGATRQQWMFLTAEEMETVDQLAVKDLSSELKTWIANVRTTTATPHHASFAEDTTEGVDQNLENALATIEEEMSSYTTPTQITSAIETIKEALMAFLEKATPDGADAPFDLSYLIDNPTLDSNNAGWSESAAWGSKCCEYYQTNFDFNQTIQMKLPAGTYEVRAQAFQRPGTLDDIYVDYVTNGKNNVNAVLYAKSKTQKIMNICEGATEKSLGTGSSKIDNLGYIPGSMSSAQAWFKKDYYDNSVWATTTSANTLKIGIKSTNNAGGGWWVCFDNFRLFYYGSMTQEDATPLDEISLDNHAGQPVYDLQGRKTNANQKGIYIIGGRKFMK